MNPMAMPIPTRARPKCRLFGLLRHLVDFVVALLSKKSNIEITKFTNAL